MHEHDIKSEAIEREALLSLHRGCPEETRVELGLFCHEIGDALVVGAGNDPSVLINRTLGLGTRSPVTRSTLEAINARYQDHDVKRYFVHLYPDALADGPQTLDGLPLVKARGWMKFTRPADAPVDDGRPTDLRVERVGRARAADFGRIVALAFGMTPAAGPLLAGLAHDPRWHLYVSYDGSSAAGAGAMFVDGGVGWLEWAATAPAFRQRGSQGAIMRARLDAARELGCSMIFTETGEAVDGDAQHSYRNIQRHGFSESILRENWAPAA